MTSGFRTPKQMRVEKRKRVIVSARIDSDIKAKLKKSLLKTNSRITLAVLIEQVLNDYVAFLELKKEI